jgi:glucosamine-6-phosphate deaminase
MKGVKPNGNAEGSEGTFERVPVEVHPGREEASLRVAAEMAELIRGRAGAGKPVVLGLATGSTPVRVYGELIRLHQEEGLSFANVLTFNLDEYYPIPRGHRESYYRFMREQFFDHIDIPEENIHIPDGEVEREEAFQHCHDYEDRIREVGGIDFQLLGIGRTGHIGFNEPGSTRESRTRLITLDALTRQDAARDFVREENVPRYAITMGVGTILEARRVVLMAWGEGKAAVVAKAAEHPPTASIPASFLQEHPAASFIVDGAAASQLVRLREPWRVRFVDWDDEMEYNAVTSLSRKSGKPVLKLVEKDYSENDLADLLTQRGPAYDLNIKVFNRIQHTITGWPGGKPDADDTFRPERAEPPRKRALVLTSEPGEEMTGMGGTLNRLIQHGHEVHLACLTSGDLSVADEEATAFLDVVENLREDMGSGFPLETGSWQNLAKELSRKEEGDADSPSLRKVKGYLREGEARLSAKGLGVQRAHMHFLRLPFYLRGRYRRFNPGREDREALLGLLRAIRPHQLYLSGMKADPASVAGTCYAVAMEAIGEAAREAWFADCRCWAYRGDGEEWPVDAVHMAVPLSPDELLGKLTAIYQHKSQQAGGPGGKAGSNADPWERIEQLNRATAREYDQLGMAEYEAMECFRRWTIKPVAE